MFSIIYPPAGGYDQDNFGQHEDVVPSEPANTSLPTASHSGIVDRNLEFQKYSKLVHQIQAPLYEGSKHIILGTVLKQLIIKHKRGKSNVCFDDDIKLMKDVLPEGNNCLRSYNEVKTFLRDLSLKQVMIDACVNNYILYYKEHTYAIKCLLCNDPRYDIERSSKAIPRKVIRYFPLRPRLQGLYMSSRTTKHMRWHKREGRDDQDILTHPRDGEAWKHFDHSFPEFAEDCRNVRLGLVADDFSPTCNMSLPYSIWLVILFPYNLPLNMCMKNEYNFLTLLVLGPTSPGKCLNVYMRPLIDEFQYLWVNGLATYDKHGGNYFLMRAVVLWTFSDYPAYGMLSGQQTMGYHACPVCMDGINSSCHANKTCYLGHRRWLPEDHKWRWDAEPFDGTHKHMPKRSGRLGGWIAEKLNQHSFGHLSSSKHVNISNTPILDEFKCWTEKNIFFDLPFWSTLKIKT